MRRVAAGLVAATLLTGLLTGCSFDGAQSLPLPGGKGGGGYELTVEFADALDLVPQSAVKVDDVTVGRVEKVELRDYTAIVTVLVERDVRLPSDTTASLRQTSLLGEKFVSLDRPAKDPSPLLLEPGATIPLAKTTRNVEIEELLSALSLVLNGGSLEQLQVINREVVAALQGREDGVRQVLEELDTFVGGLDRQKGQIVATLDALDRLSARVAKEREVLATGLDDLPDGTKVLADQRSDITALLTGLERLGEVAVSVIQQSQQATVADLKALTPILDQLGRAGKDLPDALELITTYPFPRTVDQGIRGDYANLFVTADIDLQGIAGNLGGERAAPTAPGGRLRLPDVPGTSVRDGSLVPLPNGRPSGLAGLLLGGVA